MKKSIYKLLSLLLAVSLMASLGVGALAAGEPTITVGSASASVTSGETTVTVPVSISQNPGFAGMTLYVSIPDGCAAESVAVTSGSSYAVTADMVYVNNLSYDLDGETVVSLNFAAQDDVTENGVLAWITYSVSRTADNGENAVEIVGGSIYHADALTTDIFSSFTTVGGAITVSGSAGSGSSTTTTTTTTTTTATTATTQGATVETTSTGAVITLDEGVTSAAVLIPASGLSYASVAKDTGTNEIIKLCVPTTEGMLVVVTQSCELTISTNSKTFADVSSGDWYASAVTFAAAREILNGTGSGFEPNANMDRSMVAQMLYNFDADAEPTASAGFTDVADSAWYADAVNWAAGEGIVSGTGNGEFSPSGSVTREQLAVMLYNYAKAKGYDVSASASLSAFSDASSVSSWASSAMSWAVGAGLISGVDSTNLDPTGTATRAQVATILMRFCSLAAGA
ncbi:MAG: S-layer homology domain-containing protein [Oscillospiraceae bacterium]|nr:S-layer homology domain-containing protein [Oscillospiraceae bacterium]